MATEQQNRIEITVRGRVQGVGFRYFVLQQAQDLALTGWTRNQSDGAVMTIAEGPRIDLEELASRLRLGPPMSRVGECEVQFEAASGEFEGFEIRR